jgi:hypothetical protein
MASGFFFSTRNFQVEKLAQQTSYLILNVENCQGRPNLSNEIRDQAGAIYLFLAPRRPRNRIAPVALGAALSNLHEVLYLKIIIL